MRCPNCGAGNPASNKFCGQCGTDISPPAGPAGPAEPEAERRQLTVMFCDLVGSTALSEQLDPEDLGAVIAEYQDACGRQIEAFDGYIARYMGDGILVYFGYPRAHEDDPERAIRAGLGIIDAVGRLRPRRELDLRVRLGVATGLVVAGDIVGTGASEEHTVLGVTPNLAARLQGIAEPNHLIVSQDTRRLAGDFFEYQDLGAHRLKGIREPARAWRVVGEGTVASRFEAIAVRGLTALVGRDEEIAVIRNRWKQAADGDGQVVMLQGEAGVGKSRIIDGFRGRLEGQPHGAIMLSCSPFHANSALHPVIACLKRILGFEKDDPPEAEADKLDGFLEALDLSPGELAPHLSALLIEPPDHRYPPPQGDPEQRKKMVFEALLAILQAQTDRRPTVMVVDDVHWMDPSTGEFLGLVIDRSRSLRLLLVIASRPAFKPAWATPPNLTSLTLNRLSRADSAAMIAEVTGGKDLPREVADQILTKTDGIPLFVEELTKTVLESGLVAERDGRYVLTGPLPPFAIPASLQDSLMARLDRLGSAKEVAQLAAVLGRTFAEDLLAAVSPLAIGDLRAALAELVAAELVYRRGAPPDAGYEFKHAMVQEAAYESLLKSTRQRHHRDIAVAMESGFPGIVEAEPELPAHHFSEAGLAERAVPYWRRAGARAAQRWASAESVGYARRGLEVVESLPDGGGRADHEIPLLIDLVAGLRILDRYDEALAALDRAQDVATRHRRVADLSLVHYYRGNIYFPMGNIDGCLEQHQLARDRAREAGSAEQEAHALGGLGDAYFMRGRMITANRHFADCVDLCRANGFTAIETANLPMLGHTRLYMNDLEGGLADCLAAAEMAEKAANHRAELIARGNCAGKILFDMAQFPEAMKQCRRALDLAKRLGARRFEPVNLAIVSKILALEGRRGEAVEAARQAVSTSRQSGIRFAGAMALGALALVATDPQMRRAALDEGEALLGEDCVSHNYLWFYRDAIDACLDGGDWSGARKFASAAEAYTRPEPLPWMDILIARGRALADVGGGDRNPATLGELRRLREEAGRIGFKAAIPALDRGIIGDGG